MREIEWAGGGATIEDRYVLISTANRALRELYMKFPVTKTVKLNVRGHRPSTYYKEIVCKSDQSIIIPIKGKAYSMRVVGKGNYTIWDNGGMSAFQFDTGNDTKIIRGFLEKGEKIRFWGGFTFVVYDLSVYDEMYSPEVDSIPDGSPITVYNIKEMYGDFLSFACPPTDRFGYVIDNCRVYDGSMEIDSGYSGEILITYNRLPSRILGDNPGMEEYEIIDVSDEYTNLLVYLVWYNYWYDIDYSKAEVYKDRIDDISNIIYRNKRCFDRTYINENGWA